MEKAPTSEAKAFSWHQWSWQDWHGLLCGSPEASLLFFSALLHVPWLLLHLSSPLSPVQKHRSSVAMLHCTGNKPPFLVSCNKPTGLSILILVLRKNHVDLSMKHIYYYNNIKHNWKREASDSFPKELKAMSIIPLINHVKLLFWLQLKKSKIAHLQIHLIFI